MCPATTSTWDQYGTLFLLLCCLAGFALTVFWVVGIAVVIAGGRLKDLAKVRSYPTFFLLTLLVVFVLYVSPCLLPLHTQGVAQLVVYLLTVLQVLSNVSLAELKSKRNEVNRKIARLRAVANRASYVPSMMAPNLLRV